MGFWLQNGRHFGYKTDGTASNLLSVGGYFGNYIAEVKDQHSRQDSQFYEGMFCSKTEGRLVGKQEADSRFNFGLEMLVRPEGEFTV